MERGKHFFKILTGDFSRSLRIPPDSVKSIQKDLTHAVLECSNGRIWNVELQKRSGGAFLQRGWREFVKNHSLEEYDLLVFGYDGKMKFGVWIYDRTACERDDMCRRKKATKTFKQVEGGDDFIQGQSTPSESCSPVRIKTEDVEFQKPRSHSGTSEDDFPQRGLSRRRMTACENAANAFTSDFPFFTKEMTKSCIVDGRLKISRFFSREHLGKKRRNMVLRGPDGRSWEVSYIYRHSTALIVNGWSRFVEGYNIFQAEICGFELVGEEQMQVHIFRSMDME